MRVGSVLTGLPEEVVEFVEVVLARDLIQVAVLDLAVDEPLCSRYRTVDGSLAVVVLVGGGLDLRLEKERDFPRRRPAVGRASAAAR